MNENWSQYKVEVQTTKVSGRDGFYVGVGLTDISAEKKDVIEYAIGYNGDATGVKVHKQGIEGYTLGDYSSSTAAGNLRSSCYEPLAENKAYTITVQYGGEEGNRLVCSYTDGAFTSRVLDYKLEAYNREIFHSVTKDEQHVYVKLVNADSFDKTTKIDLQNLLVNSDGRLITVTGDESLLHVPNVNKKNAEQIVPVEKEIVLDDQCAIIDVPANSVNILVLDI